jgi:hypothetical protein
MLLNLPFFFFFSTLQMREKLAATYPKDNKKNINKQMNAGTLRKERTIFNSIFHLLPSTPLPLQIQFSRILSAKMS